MEATIDVQMGGQPMYGPPYSTVSTAVSHYPDEQLATVLHVHTFNRRYNWADITQEIYGVAQCDEFASGPFVVGNLSLRDDAGRLIDMEREVHWNLTTRKPCGGVTTVVNATTVTIEHNKRTQH